MYTLLELVKIHKIELGLPESALNTYRGAGKSLAQPTSRCILFDG